MIRHFDWWHWAFFPALLGGNLGFAIGYGMTGQWLGAILHAGIAAWITYERYETWRVTGQ